MLRQGWALLFHDCPNSQLRRIHHAVQRAQQSDQANVSGQLVNLHLRS